MSNNEWVQEGTPRDASWSQEPDEYGTPVSPTEWDDYSTEQAVPVPRPRIPEPVEPEPVVEEAPAPIADEAREPAADQEAPEQVSDVAEDSDPADLVSSDEPVFFEDSTPAAPQDGEAAAEAAEVSVPDESEEPDTVAQEAGDPEAESFEPEPEEEQTRVRPLVVPDPVIAGAGVAAGAALTGVGPVDGPGIAGLYRTDGDETQVIEAPGRLTLEEEAAEEARLAEQLRAEKEARDQRLGLVATSPANAVRDSVPAPRRGVGAFGSVGLLILRLVVAALLGIVAYQVLTQIDASAAYLAQQTLIPEPRLVAWIVGFTLAGMAIFLIMGLAVRVVGLLMAVIGIAGLALLRWGAFSPFVAGQTGFVGDRDLLLVVIGILFFCIGGGKAGIDGALSAARAESREAKPDHGQPEGHR